MPDGVCRNRTCSMVSIAIQNVVVTNVQKNDHSVALIVPDDPDIHIHTAFEKTVGTLYSFGSQGWMKRVFRQENKPVFQLFLFRG